MNKLILEETLKYTYIQKMSLIKKISSADVEICQGFSVFYIQSYDFYFFKCIKMPAITMDVLTLNNLCFWKYIYS